MDAEFHKRLLETYRKEAHEHLETLADTLARVGQNMPGDERMVLLRRLFSEAHSLKGAARSVNAEVPERVCHRLESVLSDIVGGRRAWSDSIAGVLDEAIAFLVAWHQGDHERLGDAERGEATAILRKLGRLLEDGEAPEPPRGEERAGSDREEAEPLSGASSDDSTPLGPPAAPSAPGSGDGTVRTSVARLESLFFQAEQMLLVKLEGEHQAQELADLRNSLATWRREWQRLQSDLTLARRRLGDRASDALAGSLQRALLRVIHFSYWNRDFVEELHKRMNSLVATAVTQQVAVEGRLDSLLDQAKEILMQPFLSAVGGMGVFVRDAARREGKSVRFEVEGGNIELDRRILEEMKTPFLHLVRNALFHGIEQPAERQRAGKPPEGMIRFSVSARPDGNAEVRLEDDGAGVNVHRVREQALEIGLIPPGQAEGIARSALLELIFRPEFTTRGDVNELAGRGLGLAIVADKIEKLGGSVSVNSERGHGTSFTILLPMTLARMRAVLVQADGANFFLPTNQVERVVRLKASALSRRGGRATAEIAGRPLLLVRLTSLLGLSSADHGSEALQCVQLRMGEAAFLLVIDEVLDEQEILLKNLGKQLQHVRHLAGATVLGSGQVVPVLAVAELVKSVAGGTVTAAAVPQTPKRSRRSRRALLVVEDSMTARSLLKHIAEGAGYRVETASDGAEGLAKARAGSFDLILSDVEMPRMNGIELTRAVREDPKMGNLPVVLLTALASREDRERGLEAGANAYIVKTSFDESNLLDTIADLLAE